MKKDIQDVFAVSLKKNRIFTGAEKVIHIRTNAGIFKLVPLDNPKAAGVNWDAWKDLAEFLDNHFKNCT